MSRWSAKQLTRRSGFVSVDVPRRKYGNTPTRVDGIRFDSKLEAKRYTELVLLQKVGKIACLRVHNRWPLCVGSVELGYYEADFDYLEGEKQVIEDCKGVATALYRWKAKHLAAQYGIAITEIRG